MRFAKNPFCTKAFSKLLMNMREIFLQHAVIFHIDQGGDSLFNCALFNKSKFLTFENIISATLQTA